MIHSDQEAEIELEDDDDNVSDSCSERDVSGGNKHAYGDKNQSGGNVANKRKKKTRTVFTRSQVFQLESTFDMKRYLSSSERAGLAASLHLTETQVSNTNTLLFALLISNLFIYRSKYGFRYV